MEEAYSQISSVIINSFLIPLIKKGGESLANGIGDNMHNKVNDIYSKIKDRFRDDNDSKDIERFEEKPETYAKSIEELLKEKMINDKEFASTIQSLFDEISRSPTVTNITEDIEAEGTVIGMEIGNIKKGDVTSVTRRIKATKDVIGGKYGHIGFD
jgi:hypothetical protein